MKPTELIKSVASETAAPAHLSVLDTHLDRGQRFLKLWSEWRDRPAPLQSTRLVYVTILGRGKKTWLTCENHALPDQLRPLADQIQTRLTGLMSGLNRFTFDHGSLHLHVFVGDTTRALKLLEGQFDWVYLEDANPASLMQSWDHTQTGSLTKLCKHGAQLSSSCTHGDLIKSLTIHGFVCQTDRLGPHQESLLHAVYKRPQALSEPSELLSAHLEQALELQSNEPLIQGGDNSRPLRGHCAVIGAGLAGASAAYAMAKRGWSVQVFDIQAQASMGASAVPLGVYSTQLSADDNPQSRLMRAGVRLTNQVLEELLGEQEGIAWKKSGALEVRSPAHMISQGDGQSDSVSLNTVQTSAHLRSSTRKKRKADPSDFSLLRCEESPYWYTLTHQYHSALGHDHTSALEQDWVPCVMHNQGGWLKPRFLVQALLKHPRIQLCLSHTVQRIIRVKQPTERASITQAQGAASDSNTVHHAQDRYKLEFAHQGDADLNDCQSELSFDHVIVANAIGASSLLEPLLLEHSLSAGSFAHQLNPKSVYTPSLTHLLQCTYGVMNWGGMNKQVAEQCLPFAINGSGSFVTCPSTTGPRTDQHRQEQKVQTNHPEFEWYAGASFERLSSSASSYSVPYQEACKKTNQEPQQHLKISSADKNTPSVSDPLGTDRSTQVRLGSLERDAQDAQGAPTDLVNKTAQLSQDNLLKLKALYPVAHKWVSQLPQMQSWSGVRASTANHMPWVQNFAFALSTTSRTAPRSGLAHALSGVSVLAGLGSKGIALAPLCAEILACEIHQEPSPVEKDLLKSLKKII